MFVGLSSGMGHEEFCLLTSGGSLGEYSGVWSWRDVNLAAYDFVHYGGLGDCPAGFEVIQLRPGDQGRGTARSTVVLQHAEHLYLLQGGRIMSLCTQVVILILTFIEYFTLQMVYITSAV